MNCLSVVLWASLAGNTWSVAVAVNMDVIISQLQRSCHDFIGACNIFIENNKYFIPKSLAKTAIVVDHVLSFCHRLVPIGKKIECHCKLSVSYNVYGESDPGCEIESHQYI